MAKSAAKRKSVSKPKLSKLDRQYKSLRALKRSSVPRGIRKSITPGTVLIVLAGPYKGKRVVFLKELGLGKLLVTGPFRVNRVPITRIGQAFVIATSSKVDLPESVVKAAEGANSGFFKQLKKDLSVTVSVKKNKFFAKAEKPALPDLEYRKKLQSSVDNELLAAIKAKGDLFYKYLGTRFTLSRDDHPHNLKF